MQLADDDDLPTALFIVTEALADFDEYLDKLIDDKYIKDYDKYCTDNDVNIIYDLCEKHGERLTVPNGWNVIKASTDDHHSGPTQDDLMAIADAVREVGSKEIITDSPQSSASAATSLGRRGHLRAVPS